MASGGDSTRSTDHTRRSMRTPNRHTVAIVVQLAIVEFGLSPSLSSQTYSFIRYSSADGLEQTALNNVFQDARGYIWFGGIGGASRYDGNQFTPYLTTGSRRSDVLRIVEDREGTIWFATEGNGIATLRRDRDTIEWITTRGGKLPSDSVYEIMSDSMGNLWVGTRRGGLVLRPDGTSSRLTTDSGLCSNWVTAIVQDHEGGVWIATTQGVTRFVLAQNRVVAWKKVLQTTVLSLTVRKDGTVIMGTNEGEEKKGKGVFSWKNGTLSCLLHYDRLIEPTKAQTLLEDSRGILWIGTTRGCILLSRNGMTRIRHAQGLVNETVSRLIEDREGSIWTASGNGATKLTRRYTLSYTETQGLPGSNILSVLIDHSGDIWFGGYSGLYKIDASGTLHVLRNQTAYARNQVYALAQDSKGRIWIGTGTGLVLYEGKSFVLYHLPGKPSRAFVSTLAADRKGSVWVGSEKDIFKINGTSVKRDHRIAEYPTSAGVSSLLVDREGRLWFGSDGAGAGVIENGTVNTLPAADGLSYAEMGPTIEDSKGRIWFVTKNGAAYWSEGKLHQLVGRESFPENSKVISVAEDPNGHLWFGTWVGAYEWSDSILAHYDTRDGLAADIVQAVAVDRDGDVWLGTRGGLTKFERSEQSIAVPAPPLSIDRVTDEVDRRVLVPAPELPFAERTVTFQLTSLSFFDERAMEFQWRLNGLEDQWNPVTKNRYVRYTTLPAGKYFLEARARNRNGAWTIPVTYAFAILPPYWAAWWFRLLIGLVIAGLLGLAYRIRVSRLVELERLRLRIASDLHDEIGSSLGSIALETEMIQRKLRISTDVGTRLRKIAAESRQTAEAMRDIVWMIQPDHDSMETLVRKMQEVATRTLDEISHTISLPEVPIRDGFDLDFKRNLFLIYKETLYNIRRHAHATHVDIRLEHRERMLILTVRDNGMGFDESSIRAGNGLKNIRDRAAKMGADLSFESLPGKGTSLTLTVRI